MLHEGPIPGLIPQIGEDVCPDFLRRHHILWVEQGRADVLEVLPLDVDGFGHSASVHKREVHVVIVLVLDPHV